jgi:dienelactone hydrolase
MNLLGWLFLWSVATGVAGAETLGVLPVRVDGVAPKEMMRQYWLKQVVRATEAADAARAALTTPEHVAAYQARVRQAFVGALGGFPERTPLHARVAGSITREGYRVEKILFESQPQHLVTALLYLPQDVLKPIPGVLVPCGHSAGGKDNEAYQWACIQLAKSGMAALIYDPIDQGERVQAINSATGKPLVSGTAAHSRVGVGSILLGRSTATFRIWDGMRALDYLVSRPEVDAARIGCTGNSGGGTLTSYLMALDPRIKVAAPSCYITDLRHVAEKIGPQDAEQNIFGQLAFGMDHAEYLTLRAPAPTLVCSAIQDFFAIEGARASVMKAKHVYDVLGAADHVSQCEADEKHGFSVPLRAGAVGWMKRWLLNDLSAVPEPSAEPLIRGEAAWCTPRGQVMLLPGARSVYDLNRTLNDQLAITRAHVWQVDRGAALEAVRRVTGIHRLSALPPCAVEKAGTLRRDGYAIDTCILRPEEGIVLPAFVFVPDVPSGEVALYVNGTGRAADAEPSVSDRVKQGETVVAVDLRGLGETQGGVLADRDDKLGLEWKDTFAAYLLGTSYLAKRAEDILACARIAATYGGASPRKVSLVAVGQTVPAALHAAALEPGLFRQVTLRGGLNSWSEVLSAPMAENQLVNVVHGALRVYDLPDLLRTLPSESVSVVEPLVLASP